MENYGKIKSDSNSNIIEVERFLDDKFFKIGDPTTMGYIDQFKMINNTILACIDGRDYFLDSLKHVSEYKLITQAKFDCYSCFDDHVLMIKKTGFDDDTYIVIYEDAYQTWEMNILSKDEIYKKYRIKVDER